jgi:hypothetical protein
MILYVVLSLFRVRLSPNLAGLIGLSVTLCIGVSIWLISLRLDPTRLSLILVLPATPIYTLAGAFAARSLYQRYFKPSSP